MTDLQLAGLIAAMLLSALVAGSIARRASRPLRESERRYRELVAQSFGLICTHDSQGVLKMVNPAAARLLGYSPEELVGRNLVELLAPAVRDRFGQYLEQVRSGRPTEGLMRVVARSGVERVWLYRNHLLSEGEGEPYVLGHALDVTERLREEVVLKRHAAELARVNAALKAEIAQRSRAEDARDRFFDMALEMLCIAGFDGYFQQVNAAWETTLGWTLEELKSRPWMDFVHPDDREATLRESERLRLGANTVDFENRYRTKDGAYRWLCWRASSLPERGLIYAVARDVEEQRRIERMKEDLVSVVSHELRTPLTAIRGALGLIAGGLAGPLPERARSLVDIAARNSERLVRLANDILDVETIEAGQRSFRFAACELMPLIEHGLESNRTFAETYGVELRVVEPVPGARVWADPDRLQQVMANLLSNAAKFSPRGGRVEVAAARRDGRLRVSVTDHGEGIPPEFRSHVFEKFAQADISSARRNGGTGLGLSISKAIVERLGGRMGFESERGVTTTFWFELPEWEGGDRSDPGPLERARPALAE